MIHTQIENGFFLRFEKGEDFFAVMNEFLATQAITGASFHAIGAVLSVEIGFYHLDTKTYEFHTLEQPLEVVSMTGNVALTDGVPFIHTHGVFSDPKLQCFGGHINTLTVGPTLEVFLFPHSTTITRELNEEIGLKLCSFPAPSKQSQQT